jgi:hypothetical protein
MTTLAIICFTASLRSIRMRQPSKYTHIILAQRILNKLDVRARPLCCLLKLILRPFIVVLSAIQDILLQIHLRECGLL